MRDLEHPSRIPPPPASVIGPQITALAATGFSKLGVAAHFNINVHTLNEWFDISPDLQDAFNVGREKERYALHNSLYKSAIEKGNAIAAMFLLKSRHGYREGDQSEQSNKVSITFNLPGALSPAEYKTIEAVASGKPKQVNSNAD